MRLPWLDPRDDNQPFPPLERALRDPDGLLAAGGSLTPRRLLRAYRAGVFPWYSVGQPILWWSPDPRLVLFPERIHITRSLRKTWRKGHFWLSADTVFTEVVAACAAPRPGQSAGTWLIPEMQRAYERLHRLGHAHSLEVWCEQALVGGLYGVAVGGVFFGESMFSRVSDASKTAFAALALQWQRWDGGLIDCQVRTDHLVRLGAVEIPRASFAQLLERYGRLPGRNGPWCLDSDLLTALAETPP